MVEINDLYFEYKRNQPVFKNLSLDMERGKIYGVLGKNGVGKTTLLKLMGGLLFPKKGRSAINGIEAKKRLPSVLAQTYYLPEVFGISPDRLSIYGKRNGQFYPNYSHSAFLQLLKDFELEANDHFGKLSTGQQKKGMIAFAFACNTPLLLMDEPTNGLDISSKKAFRKALSTIANEEKCIAISTHQVRDLENVLDTIVMMDEGGILLNEPVEQIAKKLRFGSSSQKDEDALYSEPSLEGVLQITANISGEESPVSIELLFNAIHDKKDVFRQLFTY